MRGRSLTGGRKKKQPARGRMWAQSERTEEREGKNEKGLSWSGLTSIMKDANAVKGTGEGFFDRGKDR